MNYKLIMILNATITIVFMLSLWCIDVSVTALNLGGIMTNGWTFINPTQTYHLALCVAILSFFCICLTNISIGGKLYEIQKLTNK